MDTVNLLSVPPSYILNRVEMCGLNLSMSGYTPVAGMWVHDRQRISGVSDFWTTKILLRGGSWIVPHY
jgi:hypothetical protein